MKLAVIVPYRDRSAHLTAFVPHMATYLQGVDHHVYIIAQTDAKPFNRGKLLNAGVKLVTRQTLLSRAMSYPVADHTHVVLHDVDMLPEEVVYAPVTRPMHLAGAAEQFHYTLPYPTYFGGVTLFPVDDYWRVNGFNNDYWGWGCEDDDLLDRCAYHHLPVDRVDGRFRSLYHTPALAEPDLAAGYPANSARLRANRSGANEYDSNGMNSIAFTLKGWKALADNTTLINIAL